MSFTPKMYQGRYVICNNIDSQLYSYYLQLKYIYYRNKIPRLENFKLKQVIDNNKDVEATIYKVNQFSERERYVKGFRTLMTVKKYQKLILVMIFRKRF